jgi:hypothetical protein
MYLIKRIISVLEYRIERFYSLAKGKKSKLPVTLNSKTSKELIRGVDFSFERILSFYKKTFKAKLQRRHYWVQVSQSMCRWIN